MTVEPLEQLAPPREWEGDWPGVLMRAGVRTRHGWSRRRRMTVAAVALAAVLIPLAAIAAVNDWWFLGGGLPQPVDKPVVITKGSWNGQLWDLVAYNSQTEGTCWSITFEGADLKPGGTSVRSAGAGGYGNGGSALNCDSTVGVHLPHIHEDFPTVQFLIASTADDGVRGIAGPIVASAASVRIRFENGAVVQVPTVAPPSSLGHLRWFGAIRFFVGQLPPTVRAETSLRSITGFASNGKIVACLIYGKRYSGPYPRPIDCAGEG